jgi:uncharacterized protein (TIGR03435 family)
MRMLRALWVLLILSGAAMAQSAARPEFEVASIKPAAPDARGMFIRGAPGGRFNITNMPLKEMIVIAWRLQPFQVSGGPAWMNSVRYDISAKPDHNPKPDELQLMIQSLLEDRFQLKFHRETKELPIYALVLARKDGKLGAKLIPSKEGSCTALDPTKPPPPPEPGKPPAMGCGGMFMSQRSLTGVSVPVANMIPVLSRTLGRTIIDQTGLTGNYDINLEWTPDDTQNLLLPPDAPKPPPSDAAGPSIFTALQEQLGLKLEAQKGPVEIFVVDSAEKPSEN